MIPGSIAEYGHSAFGLASVRSMPRSGFCANRSSTSRWPWPDPINRILRTVIAVSSDLHPQHHSAILVLEVVAVKHPGLRPWKRMAKIDRDAHRFPWPAEDRVLRSDVGREAPGCIDGEPRQRVGARLPLAKREVEA